MKPRILALRAIGSTLALGIIRTAGVWALVALTALIAIIWALAHFLSPWWWVLAVPLATLTIIGAVLWMVLNVIIKNIQPAMTKSQKVASKNFIQKAQRLLDNSTTPYPILAVRLVIEVVLKRKDNLITEVVEDSASLRKDLKSLVREFN